MQKLATPTDLETELRAILVATDQPRPSRRAIAAQLRKLAARVVGKVAADDDEDHPSGLPLKRGEWTLWVLKDRATRWSYSLHNPQGGSFGSGSYTSAKAAFSAGTSKNMWEGAKKLFIVVAKFEDGKWDMKRSFWHDIPDQGEKGHGVPLEVPKLASDEVDGLAGDRTVTRQSDR